jgi:hypothetical protein
MILQEKLYKLNCKDQRTDPKVKHILQTRKAVKAILPQLFKNKNKSI